MHTYNRTFPLLPDVDFATDRAQAPMVGFVLAIAVSTTLWATVGWAVWSFLN